MGKSSFWFKLGAWAFIVTAGLHLFGHFQEKVPPSNEAQRQLHALMESEKLVVGGIERSTWDFLNGFSLTFAVFSLFTGLVGLAVAYRGDAALRRSTLILQCALAGILLALSLRYFIQPPIISFGFIFACYLMALVLDRRAPAGAD